jgi:cobalt-zinc-cadmium resistance protein CzcA
MGPTFTAPGNSLRNGSSTSVRVFLPDTAPPRLGPLTTALGEILQFEVRGEAYSPMDLRTILEWRIVPLMRQVPGVTEVNSHGGFYKSFEIRPNPDQLNTLQISLEELFEAVERNNSTTGGGYIVHHGEQRFIRGTGAP